MERIEIDHTGTILKKGSPFRGRVLSLLGQSVLLKDSVTLSSFFAMIQRYPELKVISELFDAYLSMLPAHDPAVLKTDEIEGLVFYKTIEVTGFPGTPSLSIYNSLKGVTGDDIRDLKFYHLESLLGHRLSLGQLNHIVFGDQQDEFKYDTFYTLFELLEGIAWELSFNFNPLQCSIRR